MNVRGMGNPAGHDPDPRSERLCLLSPFVLAAFILPALLSFFCFAFSLPQLLSRFGNGRICQFNRTFVLLAFERLLRRHQSGPD